MYMNKHKILLLVQNAPIKYMFIAQLKNLCLYHFCCITYVEKIYC